MGLQRSSHEYWQAYGPPRLSVSLFSASYDGIPANYKMGSRDKGDVRYDSLRYEGKSTNVATKAQNLCVMHKAANLSHLRCHVRIWRGNGAVVVEL